MASGMTKMKEEATCSICLQLMTVPVIIDCGHNFCHQCIEGIGKNQRLIPPSGSDHCPLCRLPFQRKSLRFNKRLENLIETIKEMESERLCEEHEEKLQLFCEDDEQLICWRCERSPQHRGHNTALVEEVCPGYKEKLQEIVTRLRKVEALCMKTKLFAKKQISEWKENIDLQRQKIQSDFKNLHNFLHEEEKRYLWRLENEKEQLLKRLQASEARLEKQSLELRCHILELEKKCQGSAQNLLQDVKDTLKRNSDMKVEAIKRFCLQPQTVCNVSELYFDMKKRFQRCRVSVTLDPDTAHDELILSEDQKQVTHGAAQKKHLNSKRFTALPCVLGCEVFTSGRYYFEVGVGEGSGWDVGVCLERVWRHMDMNPDPQSGFWAIRQCKKNGYLALTSPPTPLFLKEQPQLVGIFLDCEAGLVSFYSMSTGSHIFTFPKASFFGILQPYFQVKNFSLLVLPPP